MRAPALVPPLVLQEARRALPWALLLAFGLGAIVTVGAHYSNAFPSESAPYGWPGPASFENAVAMVRSDLVLAASVPALVLGAGALAARAPERDRAAALLGVWGVHAALLALAVVAAAGLGAWGAGRTPFGAWWAFVVAHAVLALSFYSLGWMWACFLRERALAVAFATWLVFLGMYEAVTRTIVFRTEGYHSLAAGAFPAWFWVAQAFSPLSSYTGILILWRPKFRDYMESAVLDGAALPGWLVPATFVALATLLWMVLPVALGQLAWWWRGRGAQPSSRRVPDLG